MPTCRPILSCLAVAIAFCIPHGARAEPLRLAVAANFAGTAHILADAYTARGGERPTVSSGSSGQLATQITQGAPFDLFLSADAERPRDLVAQGLADPASRTTYAIGQLVLWQPDGAAPPHAAPLGAATLAANGFTRLAICNPQTAPYGAASIQALHALGVYDTVSNKLVVANSVAQALQFARSGNAELAFVALAQVHDGHGGAYWLVPQKLYAPIVQDAVVLSHAPHPGEAHAFMTFLQGPQARKLIEAAGYVVPATAGTAP
ncbi:molybdenum ABC transporter, periplasmic molybdate-binding protein [Gluconacetobacter diazotrophicus PA1 5]|uniref:molybdate ABC transporter substrate-binding protein n=1 Tax=Gluconacetobacter diazotrophicus TaxID=33996 RepID=UPI000173CD70|nr:molybdate ABC transporter substrate-binding protein [Gluconacetobacter diazotrophicus]ACI51358.1 molybdenum ABC transporter, periplasmic molybdate-binding protein [Gluconacetobacter diazotrophicus PA1 5]TWB09906.1 molybdate transport system substrate-binding protein [Gluconacetobacter diazotrophicus]